MNPCAEAEVNTAAHHESEVCAAAYNVLNSGGSKAAAVEAARAAAAAADYILADIEISVNYGKVIGIRLVRKDDRFGVMAVRLNSLRRSQHADILERVNRELKDPISRERYRRCRRAPADKFSAREYLLLEEALEEVYHGSDAR